MYTFNRIKRGIAYRRAKTPWHQLAIHHAYEGYTGKSVQLKDLQITLKENEHLHLLRGYDSAKSLRMAGAEISYSSDSLVLSLDGISINIQTAEELFICIAILVDRCNEFHSVCDTVVLDIGMNVGIASLFFASMPSISKVYAYEPFDPTFKQAQINFSHNIDLKEKIKSMKIGWGAKEQVLKVEYASENKARVGVHGSQLIETGELVIEEMQIKPAAELLNEVLLKEHEKQIVIKMDCEGAEFDIIKNLKQHDLLRAVDIWMIEWHEKEPYEIIETFKAIGLRLFKMNYSSSVGMIYAVK